MAADHRADPPDEQGRRLQKLLQHIHETITLVDADGRVIETSGRYKPILGYASEFWASRSVFDLLHPDDAARVLAMRESVLARPGSTFSGEFAALDAAGNYQPLMVHASNHLDDPDVRAVVITSRNIAADKALLTGLAQARDEALAEVELRSRLIATVSHELRNPIHAMAGMAELLSTADLPPQTASLAQMLRRQIESLGTVVDDLLDMSRLGAGVVTVEPRPTLVRALIDDVVALARLGVRSPDLVVAAEVAPAVPIAVEIDPARVRQVLVNLVGNAVKFTARGRVDVRVDWSDGRLRVDVRDTGVGIPSDELDAIFESFHTGSNAGDASGAGLGLAIVRQLAELMDGTVTVTSSPGEGSNFTVVVPAAATEAPGAEADSTSPAPTSAATVLVVEDDPVNQLLATSQLARLGLDAVVVGSGEAAIELLGRGDGPDLVLMDFLLPGLDGVATTRRIREIERTTGRRAVIIGVTASAMASDRAAAAAAGMDDFLSKPVGLAGIGEALAKWLPGAVPSGDVVDVRVLEALADDLGDAALVADLVRTFLDELHGRRSAIAAAVAGRDPAAVRRSVHPLKSSSLLLGATDLGRACQRLEAVTDPDELGVAHADVAQRATAAARWFQNWLSRRALA